MKVQTRKPPVEKNEEVELQIEDLNHEGFGVGRVQGYTLFVKGALPGERVAALVVKVKKGYGYARLLEVLQPSPERMQPRCPVYGKCGGCQLQHLSYKAQLEYKHRLVQENLRRIGGLEVEVLPVIGMAEPWHYRNKGMIPVGWQEGQGVVTGFYASRSHRIIPIQQCGIQHPDNDRAVEAVRRWAEREQVSIYDEERHTGLLRHVVVRKAFQTGELMVVLVVNGEEIPGKERLIEWLREQLPQLKSVMLNVNTRRTNVILGEKTVRLWGEEYIYDTIGDVRFAISARSFYQVNPVQTQVLYDKVKQYAQLSGQETVIDAYCGIGTIALYLAPEARQVLGVEVVPEAIEDAWRNSRLNRLDNVRFVVGEAEQVLPQWQHEGLKPDVIVVDPPRKGCAPELLQAILGMRPERVVYVSCNPSTLARDLRILVDGGYQVREVQPVDMFPHTTHVECCVLLNLP